jgi:hypothetical protein
MLKRFKPTRENIIRFAILFQLYPLALYFVATLVNPDPKPWGVAAIFAIAQFLLVVIVLNWRNQAYVDMIDEREAGVRLAVKSAMLNVMMIALIVTLQISIFIYKSMPVYVAFLLIYVPAQIAEVYANWKYRQL